MSVFCHLIIEFYVLQIYSPSLWLIFHFLNNVFPRAKVQELMKSILPFIFLL